MEGMLLYLIWEAWSAFVLHWLENMQEGMEVFFYG